MAKALVNDEYGFGAVADIALDGFERMQRATGRSTRLVSQVEGDDVIIAATQPEVEHYRRLLRKAGKDKVRVLQGNPEDLYWLRDRLAGLCPTNLYFTHRFQLLHTRAALRSAERERSGLRAAYTILDPRPGPVGLRVDDRQRLGYL